MKDLLITVPKSVKWETYLQELKDVEEKGLELNFKVPFLPKQVEFNKTKVYITYNGFIRGYMILTGLKSNTNFNCETTEISWDGNFIVRQGKFISCDLIPYKGFQGFRYIDIKDLSK